MARKRAKAKLTADQKKAVTEYLINRQAKKIQETEARLASYEKRDQNKIDRAPVVAKIKERNEANRLKNIKKHKVAA